MKSLFAPPISTFHYANVHQKPTSRKITNLLRQRVMIVPECPPLLIAIDHFTFMIVKNRVKVSSIPSACPVGRVIVCPLARPSDPCCGIGKALALGSPQYIGFPPRRKHPRRKNKSSLRRVCRIERMKRRHGFCGAFKRHGDVCTARDHPPDVVHWLAVQ